MRNLSLIAIIGFLLFSCKNEKEDVITYFCGQITNPNSDTITISSTNDFEKKIVLNEDGTFSDTLSLNKSGYYTFYDGSEYATIYLSSGDSLSISLDASEFDETLKFTGKGAKENNYLMEKYLNDEEHGIPSPDLYSMDSDTFVATVDSLQTLKVDFLNSKSSGIKKEFREKEFRNIQAESWVNFVNYESANKYFTKADTVNISDKLNDKLSKIDFDDADRFESIPNYRNVVQSKFYSLEDFDKEKAFVENTKSENIKERLIGLMSGSVSARNEDFQKYYDYVQPKLDGEELANLETRYAAVKKIAKGSPAPTWTYENHKGGETSLAELKGKYVYVDVWATWCGPCKREIPFLKEVEAKYHDKNIAFVSVSIDEQKDYDTWKTMVDSENLGGVQLMADKDWESSIVTDYSIQGIPRFILIDPDGNIVNASAPNPSDKKLTETLDGIL